MRLRSGHSITCPQDIGGSLERTKVMDQSRPISRPWWGYVQFSVRGLIVLVLAIGGGLGWIIRGARVQREAVAAIQKAGGSVWYDWEWKDGRPLPNGSPWVPTWLVERLGVDYVGHVAAVHLDRGILWGIFRDRRDLNPTMAYVGQLSRLEWLTLHASSVTDALLANLKGLTNLRTLILGSTDVGDAGLAHVAHFGRLELLVFPMIHRPADPWPGDNEPLPPGGSCGVML
jgi:hypothetical protein